MTRISVRPALALALVATLTTLATGCSSLADELDREADPARTSQPPTLPPIDTAPLDTPAPSDEPDAAVTATACDGEGLRAASGMVNAAMGLRSMSITVTNCGTGEYELNGYPALTVLDEDREPVAIDVLKGTEAIGTGLGNAKPKLFTLKPGESATTSLTWRNTVTDAARPAPHGTFFDIAPVPGRAGHVLQPGDGGPIDIGTTAQLGVTAWEKAENASGATAPATSTPAS
ncbi:DUF4232 domain-containing protein [Streptomyces mesophilus]|uniref:DUF4232 domain-containing protein n=1 Tax=Streptomyces mesophilus TaxID=1775132 RepID=UPI00332C7360